jgi:hypothetical protein
MKCLWVINRGKNLSKDFTAYGVTSDNHVGRATLERYIDVAGGGRGERELGARAVQRGILVPTQHLL